MSDLQYLVIGLILLAGLMNLPRLIAQARNQVQTQPDAQVAARHLEPAPANATATPVAPSTAQLLSLVHHQTEADALQQAHETAAAAIVAAKAASKAAGLPWTVLTPAPTTPPPVPNP
jgi:hypothetical protein